MVTRLSTAEILAAARAADGKRSVATSAPVVTERTSESKAEPKTPAAENLVAARVSEAIPEDGAVGAAQPPTIATILQQIRQDRVTPDASPDVPTSMNAVLAAVRSDGRPGDACPASMTAILQRVREMCGTSSPVPRAAPTVTTPASSPAKNATKKLSTAEIIAAARQNVKPSQQAERPAIAAKPAAKATSTADILAAARRQGAATGDRTAAKRSEPKARPSVAAPQSSQPAESVADASDARPRPPAMAELLATVRSSTQARQADIEYPPLSEMLQELRRLDRRGISRTMSRPGADGWIARIRRWFTGTQETHQGATI